MQLNTTYVRLTKTVQDFGQLLPADDIFDETKFQQIVSKDPKSDWYTSVYQYGQEAMDYFKKNGGSIKGYQGAAFTDKLIFDFDSKVDLELAKIDSIEIISRLFTDYKVPFDAMRVYFSGNKGFHVEVSTEGKFSPDELKNICVNLAGDLKTFDPRVYNVTRIFRANNTFNPKGKLWKIELEPADLNELTLDQIKKKAENPFKLNFKPVPVKDLSMFDKFKKEMYKFKPVVAEDSKDFNGIKGLDLINFDECPRTTPRCMYALSHGVMQAGNGERNAIFLRLASYYRNQGMTKEVCLSTLVGIANENAKLYPEADPYTKQELEDTVVNSVYTSKAFKLIPGAAGVNAENDLIKKYCDAIDAGGFSNRKCCLHHRTDTRQTTVQIDDVSASFEHFATDFDKNTVKTGIEFIDDNMNLAVGTTTLLVGATGSGKTTVALNIMENSGQLGQHAVFFSMDMHKNLVYLKLAQKVTSYKQNQILDFYKTKNTIKIAEIRKAIAERYGKVFFDFSSTLTLEQMRDIVFKIEDENKIKVKLVMADYAGRITGPYTDRYANATHNALNSTGIAAITDAAWIFLSQISRNVGDGCQPLRTKRAAKESGDWEESATNVITMWRPFMGDTNRDDVVRMYLAKNRMGKEVEEVLHFDGAKGIIRDMSYDEQAIYNEQRAKEEKEYLKMKANKT